MAVQLVRSFWHLLEPSIFKIEWAMCQGQVGMFWVVIYLIEMICWKYDLNYDMVSAIVEVSVSQARYFDIPQIGV